MPTEGLRLVIGNKTWSSWSLRPWLVMKRAGIPFEEVNVRLRTADSKAAIRAHSASGKVPALYHGDLVVWDSLAIIEYLADCFSEAGIWPQDPAARAIARAISAEMHSGFQAFRETCAMDFLARKPLADVPETVALNIRRIVEIWRDCRARYGEGGPFLFGAFSAADAMYGPVCSRFETYIPDLSPFGDDGTAAAYVAHMMRLAEMAEWGRGARAEAEAEAAPA